MTDNGWTRGLTPLAVTAVFLYLCCGALAAYFTSQLTFADMTGVDPPWYFIRQDAINGMCMLLYFVACVTVGTLAIRKNWPGGAAMVLLGVIWSAAPIWQLGLSYLKSEDIFAPTARTSWSTFDSYINDPMRWGWLLLFLLALPYVEYIKKWQTDRP